jgi:hypothetical protein
MQAEVTKEAGYFPWIQPINSIGLKEWGFGHFFGFGFWEFSISLPFFIYLWSFSLLLCALQQIVFGDR